MTSFGWIQASSANTWRELHDKCFAIEATRKRQELCDLILSDYCRRRGHCLIFSTPNISYLLLNTTFRLLTKLFNASIWPSEDDHGHSLLINFRWRCSIGAEAIKAKKFFLNLQPSASSLKSIDLKYLTRKKQR